MSDVEVGTKRSNAYDEYGEISYKKSRADGQKMRFLLVGRFCGAIIGKGGENIKRLRSEYSVQVNLPDTRSSERVLTLTGDRESCVNVIKEILPVSCKEAPYPVDLKKKCAFEINFLAESEQVGAVIGKGGQKIRDIRDESNGKVKVYQDCLPNSNERIVAIGGDDESRLLAAFEIVLDVLRDHPRRMQAIYYDPNNKNSDGQSGSQVGMGGGLGMGGGNQLGGLGGGLGGLGGLGALGGLGGLAAGAASLLGQLGVGAQGGGGILGAAGGMANMWGNNQNNRDGILGTGESRGGQSGGFGGEQYGGFAMNRNQTPPRGGRGGDDYRQPQSQQSGGDYRQSQQGGGILDEYYGQKSNQSIVNSFSNMGGNNSNRDNYDDKFRNKGFGDARPNQDMRAGYQAGGLLGEYNGGSSNRDNRNGFDSDERDRGEWTQMHTVTKVTVSNDMCGAIIGKSGQRIKEIRQNTGARVEFTETEKGSKEDRVITITGTTQQTMAAQQMMGQCVRNRNK